MGGGVVNAAGTASSTSNRKPRGLCCSAACAPALAQVYSRTCSPRQPAWQPCPSCSLRWGCCCPRRCLPTTGIPTSTCTRLLSLQLLPTAAAMPALLQRQACLANLDAAWYLLPRRLRGHGRRIWRATHAGWLTARCVRRSARGAAGGLGQQCAGGCLRCAGPCAGPCPVGRCRKPGRKMAAEHLEFEMPAVGLSPYKSYFDALCLSLLVSQPQGRRGHCRLCLRTAGLACPMGVRSLYLRNTGSHQERLGRACAPNSFGLGNRVGFVG